jgi:hypothetical protein
MFVAVLGGEAGAGNVETREALGRLDGITPGDFATVVRRAAMLDEGIDAAWLAGALAEEWKSKPISVRGKVGFGR